MRTEVHLASTSSGPLGYSVQSGFLGCSLRAAEHERSRIASWGMPYQPDPEELALDRKGLLYPKPNAMLRGSFFGELAQQYVSGRPYALDSPVYWEGTRIDLTHAASISTGWEMYRAFIEKHQPGDFGEVLGCEIPVRLPAELLGLEMTGNMDFASRKPSESAVWVNDFKTTEQVDSKEAPFANKYSIEHQCWLYALAYHLETGYEIAGIRHIVQTARASDTYVIESEGLTPARMRWLQRYADEVVAQKANIRPQPAPHHCVKWSKGCQFLVDSLCSKV
jgi:hypothetical protein